MGIQIISEITCKYYKCSYFYIETTKRFKIQTSIQEGQVQHLKMTVLEGRFSICKQKHLYTEWD